LNNNERRKLPHATQGTHREAMLKRRKSDERDPCSAFHTQYTPNFASPPFL
jgi:hypothetical protein